MGKVGGGGVESTSLEDVEDGDRGGLIRYRRRQMQEQYKIDEYFRRLSQVKSG